jgi:hypothetical protein
MAADFVRRAKLTPEAARTHRYSSALTRAIGPLATVEVETLILDVLPDDVFLLCSDGLTQHIASLGELAPYLMTDNLEASPKKLIDLANQRGGGDNITAIVVGVGGADSQRPDRHLEESVRHDLASLRAAELFAEIPFAHLLRIYAVCDVRDWHESEPVLSVGDEVQGLYCVLSGSFQLEREDGTKQELTTGDSFGGPALLVQGASHAKLTAAGGGRLLFLDGDRFRQLAAARPRVALTLLSRMAQDAFTELERKGKPLGLLRARKRLAWWNPLAWARIAGWSA